MQPWLTLVGIGEDGYAGLGNRAPCPAGRRGGGGRAAPAGIAARCIRARRSAWPSPFTLEPLLQRRGAPVCVLASGDPMLFGVGPALHGSCPPRSCAYCRPLVRLPRRRALGWPLQDATLVSLVARPLAALNLHLHDGARLLVLSNDGDSPAAIAALLAERGFGPSAMTVLEHLGGPAERRIDGVAGDWSATRVAALNLVAIDCRAGEQARHLPLTCGLPDDAYRHDGQLTKRDVRAITLARLAPRPGQLLWDVGAGSGSIGIEWMRAHPGCRAIAVEADEGRQGHIRHNRDALGVPGLQLVAGQAPPHSMACPRPMRCSSAAASPSPACWSSAGAGSSPAAAWWPTP